MEILNERGSLLWPSNVFRLLRAWSSYMRVGLKLSLYEYYISVRRALGMSVVL